MPSPDQRAHEAGEEERHLEAGQGRQQRLRRQQGNMEARVARLEAREVVECAAARNAR
jgi:hypothetical protein